MGQGGWGLIGSDAAGILQEGAVAHMEQPVLDLPVVAGKLQQGSGIHAILGNAGDGVDDLTGAERPGFAPPLDPADAPQAGPVFIQAGRQFGAYRDYPRLDATVAAIDVFGALEVRRVSAPGRGSDIPTEP